MSVQRLHVEQHPAGPVVVVGGDVDEGAAMMLRLTIERLGEKAACVDVDMAEVTFIGSSGLSALLAAQADLLRSGARMRVRRPSRAVQRTLAVAGLDRILLEGCD